MEKLDDLNFTTDKILASIDNNNSQENKSNDEDLIRQNENVSNDLPYNVISLICCYLNDCNITTACKGIKNKLFQKDIILRITAVKYFAYVITKNQKLELYNIFSKYDSPEYEFNLNKILSPVLLIFSMNEIIFHSSETKSLVCYNLSTKIITFSFNSYSKINVMNKLNDNNFAAISNNEILVYNRNFPNALVKVKINDVVTCSDYNIYNQILIYGTKEGSLKYITLENNNDKFESPNLLETLCDFNLSNKFSKDVFKTVSSNLNKLEHIPIFSIKFFTRKIVISINQQGMLCYWDLKSSNLKHILRVEINRNYKIKEFNTYCGVIHSNNHNIFTSNLDQNLSYYKLVKFDNETQFKQFNVNQNYIALVNYRKRTIYNIKNQKYLCINKQIEQSSIGKGSKKVIKIEEKNDISEEDEFNKKFFNINTSNKKCDLKTKKGNLTKKKEIVQIESNIEEMKMKMTENKNFVQKKVDTELVEIFCLEN